MWFNEEHYPDPTAAEAIDRVMPHGGLFPVEEDCEGLARLVEAVTVTAVQDYMDMLRGTFRSDALLKEKRELEDFFVSDWFRFLTGMNGKTILRRIRKEMKPL